MTTADHTATDRVIAVTPEALALAAANAITLDAVHDLATRWRTITLDDQAAMVTVRALGDELLRTLDGTGTPKRDQRGMWPPPVIGTTTVPGKADPR